MAVIADEREKLVKDHYSLKQSSKDYNNFGDAKSLVTHPATTTHRVIGEEGRKILNISDNMIRLSIGLEDVEDLIEDIDQAFQQINI